MPAMRFVALLIVIAIICLVLTHRGPVSSVPEAMREADAVTHPAATTAAPGPTATVQPAPQSAGLRAPLDRTRAVLGQIKQRNGGGEF
jgi:hypothetical protein